MLSLLSSKKCRFKRRLRRIAVYSWCTLKLFENRIAKAVNGHEIIVSVVPENRKQNTREGFKWVQVGHKVVLENGTEVQLHMDGRSFYTEPNQMFRLV